MMTRSTGSGSAVLRRTKALRSRAMPAAAGERGEARARRPHTLAGGRLEKGMRRLSDTSRLGAHRATHERLRHLMLRA
jgi:hypothetical protein